MPPKRSEHVPPTMTEPEPAMVEPTAGTMDVLKDWLLKEPGFWAGKRVGKAPPGVKKWDRRWFVLEGARLNYYNTEEETEPNLKGILDISKCSIVGKSSRHSDSHDNYELQVAAENRTYWIRCENAERYELWEKSLISARTLEIPAGSPMVEGARRKVFRKRQSTEGDGNSPKGGDNSPNPSEPRGSRSPTGYVVAQIDFVEVTYCDAAWWENSGYAGLSTKVDADMRYTQILQLESTEQGSAKKPELPTLKVKRNETIFDGKLKIMASEVDPETQKAKQAFHEVFIIAEDQKIKIHVAILTPEGSPFEAHCSLKGCDVRIQKAKKNTGEAYIFRVDLDNPDSMGQKYYQFAAESMESVDNWMELFKTNSKTWQQAYEPWTLPGVPPFARMFHPESKLTKIMQATITITDKTTEDQALISLMTDLMQAESRMLKTRSGIVDAVALNNDLFAKFTEFQSLFNIPDTGIKDTVSKLAWCIHELRWQFEFEALPLASTARDNTLKFPVYSLPDGVEIPVEEPKDQTEKPPTYIKPDLAPPNFAHMGNCLRAYTALVEATQAAPAVMSEVQENVTSGLAAYKEFADTNAAKNIGSMGLDQEEGQQCMDTVNSNAKQLTSTPLDLTHKMIRFLAKAMTMSDKISRGKSRAYTNAAALKTAVAEHKKSGKEAAEVERERLRAEEELAEKRRIQEEELAEKRRKKKEKDEPVEIELLPRLFFTGVMNVDETFLKARNEVASVVSMNNEVVKKIAVFKQSMPRLDDDDTPSLARCFGALRDLLSASGLELSIAVGDTFRLNIPAEEAIPEDLRLCMQCLKEVVDVANKLASDVELVTEVCLASIDDASSLVDEITSVLETAGMTESQQEAIQSSVMENFTNSIQLGTDYCNGPKGLAETGLYLRRSFDGTKRQVALVRPREGWVVTDVESTTMTFMPKHWYANHTHNKESLWLRSMQEGPRIRHFYRSKVESGPALQPLAAWYGDASGDSLVRTSSGMSFEKLTTKTKRAKHTLNEAAERYADAVRAASLAAETYAKHKKKRNKAKAEETQQDLRAVGAQHSIAAEAVADLQTMLAAAEKCVFGNGGIEQTTHAKISVANDEKHLDVWIKLLNSDLWVYTDEKCEHVFVHMWLGEASVLETGLGLATNLPAGLTALGRFKFGSNGTAQPQKRDDDADDNAAVKEEDIVQPWAHTFDVELSIRPAQGRDALRYTLAFETNELCTEWRRCIISKTTHSPAVLTIPTITHPRVTTPLATAIQLQNEEEDGFQSFWALVVGRELVLKTRTENERGGQFVGKLMLAGCSAKENWGVGCRIKKRALAKRGHDFVFGLELQQPSSFGDTKYLVSVLSEVTMNTWIDCMNAHGQCQVSEDDGQNISAQTGVPKNWVAGVVTGSKVKFFNPNWWHKHGDNSTDDNVPSKFTLKPMTQTGVASVDSVFSTASALIGQVDIINSSLIDALESFKSAISMVNDVRDQGVEEMKSWKGRAASTLDKVKSRVEDHKKHAQSTMQAHKDKAMAKIEDQKNLGLGMVQDAKGLVDKGRDVQGRAMAMGSDMQGQRWVASTAMGNELPGHVGDIMSGVDGIADKGRAAVDRQLAMVDGMQSEVENAVGRVKSLADNMTFANCVEVFKQEMRNSGINLPSCLSITVKNGKVGFDLCFPQKLPSPLGEMVDAITHMVQTMKEIFTTQVPAARRQLGDLVKACTNLVASVPGELAELGFDMVDVTEKMFALKNNVKALMQLKTVISACFKTVNNFRGLLVDTYKTTKQSVMSMVSVNDFDKYDTDNDGRLSKQEVDALMLSMDCGCSDMVAETLWTRYSSVPQTASDDTVRYVTMQKFPDLHKVLKVEAALHKLDKIEATSKQMLEDEPEKTTLSRAEMVKSLKAVGHKVTDDMFQLMCKRFCIPEENITVKKFKMVESKWEKCTVDQQSKQDNEDEKDTQRRAVVLRSDSAINGHVHVYTVKTGAEQKADQRTNAAEDEEGELSHEKKDQLDPTAFTEQWIEVEDRVLRIKDSYDGKDKHSARYELTGCKVFYKLGMPAKMKLASAGHAYVFCLSFRPSQRDIYISTDSIDSLDVWRQCFQANSKLKCDDSDSSDMEAKVLKGVNLLNKGFKIGSAIGSIAIAAQTGNVGGVVGGLGKLSSAASGKQSATTPGVIDAATTGDALASSVPMLLKQVQQQEEMLQKMEERHKQAEERYKQTEAQMKRMEMLLSKLAER